MRHRRAERAEADRIMSGFLPIDATDPSVAAVARMLDAGRPSPDDHATPAPAFLAAMVEAAWTQSPERAAAIPARAPRAPSLRSRIAVVLVAGALLSGTSLAFAGALPGGAQDVAKTVLSKIGITVPGHVKPKPQRVEQVPTIAPSPPRQSAPGKRDEDHGKSGQDHGTSDNHGDVGDHAGQGGPGRDGGDQGSGHSGDDSSVETHGTPQPEPSETESHSDDDSSSGSGPDADGTPDEGDAPSTN